jgi:hypothetical protein
MLVNLGLIVGLFRIKHKESFKEGTHPQKI